MSDLELAVYDRSLSPVAPLARFVSADVTVCRNARGALSVTVAASDAANADLQAEGARVLASWKGEPLFSGFVIDNDGGFLRGGLVTYEVEDDWAELDSAAWVRPDAELEATTLSSLGQAVATGVLTAGTVLNQDGYYAWPSSRMSAETAVKLLLTQNLVGRLDRPIVVAPDLGRGAVVEVPQVRFPRLEEPVQEILTAGGLGLSVVQHPGETFIRIDVVEGREYPSPIFPESGLIAKGTWSRSAATATRVVVMGNGEDAERIFRGKVDAQLEARTGRVREVVTESTGAKLEYPEGFPDEQKVAKYHLLQDVPQESKDNLISTLEQALRKALTEGAPTSGVAVELSTSESFFFGPGGFELGDLLTIRDGDTEFVDQITEVRIVASVDGETVTPTLGQKTDDPTRALMEVVAALGKYQSAQARNK